MPNLNEFLNKVKSLDEDAPPAPEVYSADEAELKREQELHDLEMKDKLNDIGLRKTYARFILGLVALVIVTTYVFLGLIAAGKWTLTDEVLKSVMYALVVEVLGLVIIVTNYLFKK